MMKWQRCDVMLDTSDGSIGQTSQAIKFKLYVYDIRQILHGLI
jgi:hypothetical protein